MSRVPLRNNDLAVGQPAKWDIFDSAGKVLIKRGTLIDSDQVLMEVLQKRCVRDLDFGAGGADMEGMTRRRAGQNNEREVRLPLDETRIKPGDPIQLQDTKG